MNALAAAGHTRGRVSLANDSFSPTSPRRVPRRLARTRVRASSREASRRTRASPSPARPRVHARSDILPEATQTKARRRRRLGDPHRSIFAHIHSKTPTVHARSMTIKNKGPDRTNGKKSARDRRRARAMRDETNVSEFVRLSDARGRRPDGRVVRDGRGRARCASFVSIGGARGEEEEGCRRRWVRARAVDDEEENARGAIDRVGVRDGDRGVGSGVDGERM